MPPSRRCAAGGGARPRGTPVSSASPGRPSACHPPPGLHLLGLSVARVSGAEVAEAARARAARRAARLAAARRPGSPSPLGLLRWAWLRAGHLAVDHTRSALILSVFAFKVRARS